MTEASPEQNYGRDILALRAWGAADGAGIGVVVGIYGWLAETTDATHTASEGSLGNLSKSPGGLETGLTIGGPTFLLAVVGAAIAPRVRAWRWRRALRKSFTALERGSSLEEVIEASRPQTFPEQNG